MSLVTELWLEDEERRIAEVRAEYEAKIAVLQQRVQELEARNAELLRAVCTLSDSFAPAHPLETPLQFDPSHTYLSVSAERSADLTVGSYFKFVADPSGVLTATALKAEDADNMDGVVVSLSDPGRVSFIPMCTRPRRLPTRGAR